MANKETMTLTTSIFMLVSIGGTICVVKLNINFYYTQYQYVLVFIPRIDCSLLKILMGFYYGDGSVYAASC